MNETISLEKLYLIGITSIFIASKIEEVRPLSVKLIEKELGHDQFTDLEILEMELDIL